MPKLSLAGIEAPLAFTPAAEPVRDALAAVLVGWPRSPAVATGAEPLVEVDLDDRGVHLTSPAGDWKRLEPTPESAVCTLVVELMAAYVDADPALGNLHAGAVEIGGRLIVFPATNRAGKSTLVTALGAASHRVFADDLLPIDLRSLDAVASGCLPRLRLPLPPSATEALKRAVEERSVLSDGYYGFVAPPADKVVRHGDRAPIGAVVLLDRVEMPVKARLEGARADEALLRVLIQDTKSRYAARWTFERYFDLIETVRIERLTYSDIGDAISCLESAFSDWTEPDVADRSFKRARRCLAAAGGTDPEARRGHAVSPLARCPDARSRGERISRRCEAQRDPPPQPVRPGCLEPADEPTDELTIIELFVEAFPEISVTTIQRDIGALLGNFESEGLVERVA
jgi:hypothetical protein